MPKKKRKGASKKLPSKKPSPKKSIKKKASKKITRPKKSLRKPKQKYSGNRIQVRKPIRASKGKKKKKGYTKKVSVKYTKPKSKKHTKKNAVTKKAYTKKPIKRSKPKKKVIKRVQKATKRKVTVKKKAKYLPKKKQRQRLDKKILEKQILEDFIRESGIKPYTYKGMPVSDKMVELVEGMIEGTDRDLQEVLNDKKVQAKLDKLKESYEDYKFKKIGTTINFVYRNGIKDVIVRDENGEEKIVSIEDVIRRMANINRRLREYDDSVIEVSFKVSQDLEGNTFIDMPSERMDIEEMIDDLEDRAIIIKSEPINS